MDGSFSDHRNPYQSPGAVADARAKLGWLVMLLILWPIVMASVGSIIGFFVGRLAPDRVDPRIWNPGTVALGGACLFAAVGLAIGARKASVLRGRLEQIHARREELRLEVERRLGNGADKTGLDSSDRGDWARDERAP